MKVGGERTEKKLIDYIPEPQRQDLIDEHNKISIVTEKIKKYMSIRGNKLEMKPVHQTDLFDICQILLELATRVYDANTAIVEITGLYYKDKELS